MCQCYMLLKPKATKHCKVQKVISPDNAYRRGFHNNKQTNNHEPLKLSPSQAGRECSDRLHEQNLNLDLLGE